MQRSIEAGVEPTSSQSDPLKQATVDVVFSLVDGCVWASWPGSGASVKLGQSDSVVSMMQNFLDQCALGVRLGQRNP